MLAKDVEHTVDVDGMLDRMTPQQFAEWAAMYRIWNPQDDEDKDPISDSLAAMRRMTGV